MSERSAYDEFLQLDPDGVDVLSPDFDRSAYESLLKERHEKAMKEVAQGQGRTWSIKPEELDIYSSEFSVEAYIDNQITQAKNEQKLKALIEKLAALTPDDTPRAKDVATMQGALTTINGRLAIPSMPDFEDIFSPNKVKILPTGSTIIDESGEVKLPNDADIKSAWKTNAAKMAALLQMATPSYESEERRIQVYLPTVCRELSIDPRKYSSLRKQDDRSIKDQRFDAFTKWLAPVEAYMLPLNGVYYRACIIESYDATSETVTLNPPFFLRLLETMQQTQVNHAQLNRFFHADVANEENEVAIAVAFYIANSILRRGQRPDKEGDSKVTYRCTYSNIIKKCVQLNKALAEITTRQKTPGEKDTRTQAYNEKLKQVFETAYRIILEKSDFPLLFVDLKINGVSEWEDPASKMKRATDPKKGNRRTASKRFCIPTKTKLNTQLKITHNGRNPLYIKRQ